MESRRPSLHSNLHLSTINSRIAAANVVYTHSVTSSRGHTDPSSNDNLSSTTLAQLVKSWLASCIFSSSDATSRLATSVLIRASASKCVHGEETRRDSPERDNLQL